MAFSWSNPRVSPIAVDFGLDSIKLLQLCPGDVPTLMAAAHMAVPPEVRNDHSQRLAFYAEALKQLMHAQPFKGKRAIFSIPAIQTLVQHVQVTKTPGQDLDAQVGVILRQKMNIDPSRLVMRHVEVGPVMRDGVGKHEVICMAASRDIVQRYLNLAAIARLDVVGMHCEPLAMLQAFAHLYRRQGDDQRTTCFIDIGSMTTKVIIAHGDQMVFAKNINVAGEHFLRALSIEKKIDLAAARQLRDQAAAVTAVSPALPARMKNATGVDDLEPENSPTNLIHSPLSPALTASSTSTRSATQTAPAAATMSTGIDSEAMDCLIDELQLSQRYHQSLFPGRVIEKLVFLGGEARQIKTCQRIAKALRTGAQLGDPLARVVRAENVKAEFALDLRQPQPGWAVPMGLCLMPAQGDI